VWQAGIEANKKLNKRREKSWRTKMKKKNCEVSPRQNQYLKNNTQASLEQEEKEDCEVGE
jgi:hypothetical protein